MQTLFTLAQLADPQVAESERILRACVHCGFCTATCPTYVLDGDELDSPRGRIYLIKDMLEFDRPASPEVVKHIDRCLSCLGLHDHLPVRGALHAPGRSCPRPHRGHLRAPAARPLAARHCSPGSCPTTDCCAGPCAWRGWRGRSPACSRPAASSRLPPCCGSPRLGCRPAARTSGRRVVRGARRPPGQGRPPGRLRQPGDPAPINQAAIRVLTRHGIEVVLAAGQGCCGSLVHHLGREQDALAAARANIDAWMREIAAGGLDAIVVTASGCGTTVKDYGFMLRGDSAYAGKAARISALARDISEYLAGLELSPAGDSEGLIIAYHSACSLQHGQKIARQPKDLLCKIGFVVKDVPEGHLCCGSAGTYNILQPDIARRLRDRKVGNIEKLEPDVIAAGNIGCITQIAAGTAIPVVHTVELIDWATGGRKPEALMHGGLMEVACRTCCWTVRDRQ